MIAIHCPQPPGLDAAPELEPGVAARAEGLARQAPPDCGGRRP